MTFVREVRSRSTTRAIGRLTEDMVRLPLDQIDLAPRICRDCVGRRRGDGAAVCATCHGAGTTRRFVGTDPSHAVLVQGPCGLGRQRLVAVALADGRAAFIYERQGDGEELWLYVPRPRAAGPSTPALAPQRARDRSGRRSAASAVNAGPAAQRSP